MKSTGVFHHIATFLLFASAILILITTISAPVVGDIGILKVTLTNKTDIRHSSLTFGTFGHCALDVPPVTTDQDYCSGKSIGYDPAKIMIQVEGTKFSTAARNTVDGLAKVMVLHPICCGLAFIAFLLNLGAGIVGGLFATAVALITWILTLVVLVTDFVSFGIIKNHVNGDGSGSHAVFGPAMWTLLGAFVLLFIATFMTFFTCLSSRKHRHDAKVVHEKRPVRRHFWQRRRAPYNDVPY